jgi:glyoxylase-like metal-dependent hydrolase (beta-lactamase superfamily II)
VRFHDYFSIISALFQKHPSTIFLHHFFAFTMSLSLGTTTIDLLDTGSFALDGGAMFGVVPKTLWTKAYHEPDERNRIPMKASAMLIRGEFDGGQKTILVDTGNGTKWADKLAAIYKIDHRSNALQNSLAALGLTADDITDVVLTHLHFDHAGGGTTLKDPANPSSEVIPAFANARYHVQKDQLAWALKPSDKDRASFMKQDFEPLVANGMMETIDGEGVLWQTPHSDAATQTSVGVLPLHGHSKAMQAVVVRSGGKTLLYPADLFPTSAHVPVPYVMAYDIQPLASIEEKKRILPQAYEESWTVVFEHDAFCSAATIISTDKGFMRGTEVSFA